MGWPQYKVPVVGHDAISDHAHRRSRHAVCEKIFECVIVTRMAENAYPLDRAIEHVEYEPV